MLRSLEASFVMWTDTELPMFRKTEIPSTPGVSNPGRVVLLLLG